MSDGPTDRRQSQRLFNLTLASVAGQVGCLTLVIVLVALFAGLWLDSQFGTRPLFTLILMVASVPVTIVVMYRVATAATSRIKPVPTDKAEPEEEVHRAGNHP
jgi:F0F1-type ATP synthase assembly protein I